ncbi:MAG: chemotaxis protein CheW, partial [Deltaproteobacteria bacterium]|nr:chemotaxis protein CheW [Deltaproteobacteria bacterium]
PRMDVAEVIDLKSFKESKINGKERVVQYRDSIIPVLNLGSYMSSGGAGHKEGKQAFLIYEGGRAIAVEIDQIAWQQEVSHGRLKVLFRR